MKLDLTQKTRPKLEIIIDLDGTETTLNIPIGTKVQVQNIMDNMKSVVEDGNHIEQLVIISQGILNLNEEKLIVTDRMMEDFAIDTLTAIVQGYVEFIKSVVKN